MGYNGIKEKDIVLSISSELKKELERNLKGVDIIMTREDDSFVSLEQRGELANSIEPAKNPVFISIHANVSYDSDSFGYESYYLSIDSFGESARDVAMKENSVLKYEVNNYNEYLKEIINRIVDIEYRRESMLLANYIQKRLKESVGSESIDRGVKSAFFYILKTVAMPAILVEVGFVTNKKEAINLLEPEYQKKVARGIASGIEDFLVAFQTTAGFTR
jgi:N-acetylmuramoyl-L-alanine amidase